MTLQSVEQTRPCGERLGRGRGVTPSVHGHGTAQGHRGADLASFGGCWEWVLEPQGMDAGVIARRVSPPSGGPAPLVGTKTAGMRNGKTRSVSNQACGSPAVAAGGDDPDPPPGNTAASTGSFEPAHPGPAPGGSPAPSPACLRARPPSLRLETAWRCAGLQHWLPARRDVASISGHARLRRLRQADSGIRSYFQAQRPGAELSRVRTAHRPGTDMVHPTRGEVAGRPRGCA